MLKHKTNLTIILAVEFIAIALVILLVFFAGKKSYTVTFDLNGGTLLSGDTEQTVTRGGNATPPVAAKDGCYLHSWSGSYNRVTKDVKVKAIWEYENTVGINYVSAEDGNYCEIVSAFPDIQGDVYIGAYHNGKKVLGIRDGAFKNCTGITNIYMLDGIITIGSSAFEGCTSLQSIALPSTIVKLGDRAFYGCENLEKIDAPASLKSIGVGAFSGCTSIESLKFNDSLTNIGGVAFSGCISLSEVVFGEKLKEIGAGAFSGCSSLTNVYIPESVTSIGLIAFDTDGLKLSTPSAEADKPVGWVSGWCTSEVTLEWESVADEDGESTDGDAESGDKEEDKR